MSSIHWCLRNTLYIQFLSIISSSCIYFHIQDFLILIIIMTLIFLHFIIIFLIISNFFIKLEIQFVKKFIWTNSSKHENLAKLQIYFFKHILAGVDWLENFILCGFHSENPVSKWRTTNFSHVKESIHPKCNNIYKR